MELSLSDITEEDRGLIAPCGIICAGCDWYTNESGEAAKKIIQIWEGHKLADVAIIKGLNSQNVQLDSQDVLAAIKTLKQYVETGSCSGCHLKKGGWTCIVGRCVKEKGYWTCAECADYDPESTHPCPHTDTDSFPNLSKRSRSEEYDLTCKRYNDDIVKNLKKCREIGYPAFIAEIKKKVEKGWRTWQVISPESINKK